MNYQLEKSLWTEQDFEQMGWHDSHIYAVGFEEDTGDYQNSLLLDIDYIFQWNKPIPPDTNFTFHVAPCTLEFVDMHNLKIDIETGNTTILEIEIADIQIVDEVTLKDGSKTKSWKLELHNGDITFEAKGYRQYVRKLPVYTESQNLNLKDRDGISLERKMI